MPSQLLDLFKFVFLAALYLFFIRVLRAVWTELREPKAVAVVPASVAASPATVGGASRRGAADETVAHATSAPPGPGRTERLTITAPPERQGQSFGLGEELTVGRAPGCGVSLPDDTFVSTLHARVFRRDGDLWVEDLGSTNGTYLNDRRVTAAQALRRGDRLQIGKTVLELGR